MKKRIALLPNRPARSPGATEKRLGRLILLLLALCGGLYAWAGQGEGPPSLRPAFAPPPPASALPLTSPAGWPRGNVEHYAPDDLFEKINGKADAYIALDVESLQAASYANANDASVFADAYLFDMGDARAAYGIYRAQRSGSESAYDAGEEGAQSGSAVFFRKGRHYVEVIGSGPTAHAEVRRLAEAVATALPPAGEPLRDPPWFPSQGRTIVRYARRSALGVEGMTNAFLALYDDGRQAAVALTASADAAANAHAEARENFAFLKAPIALATEGAYVLGVVGGEEAARTTLLAEVLRRLKEDK